MIIGHSYFQERDFPRAIESYRVLLALDPKSSEPLNLLGRAYRAMGDYRKAIEMYAQAEVGASGSPLPTGNPFDRLRKAYEERGRQGYWEEKWRQLPQNASCYTRAAIRARLEDVDGAIELLRESLRAHECEDSILGSVHLGQLLVDDDWDPLRQDPRYKALLEAAGFTIVNPKLAE